MLIPAVAAWQFILALHIVAVVAAFGVVFSYPLFIYVGLKLDPTKAPWLHRMQAIIGQRLINPGLAVILLAGIYLASDLHQWKQFYVQWGLAAVVVLGALEGAVMIKGENRLAELAERDLAASAGGEVQFSEEYQALLKRLGAMGSLLVAIIVVTVYFMASQTS